MEKQVWDVGLEIANEYLDSHIKSQVTGVICKFVTENAYVHVNWDTLIFLLDRMSFGNMSDSFLNFYNLVFSNSQ